MSKGAQILTYVAVDMGTSGSGCAYCTKETESINQVSLWTSWGDAGDVQFKNPSVILYEDDRPLCWGIDALRKYRRMRRLADRKASETPPAAASSDGDGVEVPGESASSMRNLYLVENFKLNIHTKEPIIVRGKRFKVEKVVQDFLRLIRVDVSAELEKQNKMAPPEFVKWTLTVPAIWSDADKALMRRAARHAGILRDDLDDNDHFMLALEPESAALPCLLYENVRLRSAGKRFLVFDAGGGTIDLSVYETTKGTTETQFRIRQLRKASGGTCGGKRINEEMMGFVKELLGPELYEKLSSLASFPALEHNMERFKIGYTLDNIEDDDEFFIQVPMPIVKFFQTDACQAKLDEDTFDPDEGELIMSGSVMKRIYEKTTRMAIGFVEEILKEVDNMCYIFMVGGFSSSNILYHAVKEKFQTDKLLVIKPSQPGIRVLQGAIWFAKNPNIIVSRCSPLTYGVNVTDVYDPSIHTRDEHIVEIDGKVYSQCLFKVMIRANEIVETGTRVKIGVRAIKSDFATFEVFCSRHEPVYVDDPRCKKLTKVTIPLRQPGQQFDVYIIFGETELKFQILDSATREKLIHTAVVEFSDDVSFVKEEEDWEDDAEEAPPRKPPPLPKKPQSLRRRFHLGEQGAVTRKPPVPRKGRRPPLTRGGSRGSGATRRGRSSPGDDSEEGRPPRGPRGTGSRRPRGRPVRGTVHGRSRGPTGTRGARRPAVRRITAQGSQGHARFRSNVRMPSNVTSLVPPEDPGSRRVSAVLPEGFWEVSRPKLLPGHKRPGGPGAGTS